MLGYLTDKKSQFFKNCALDPFSKARQDSPMQYLSTTEARQNFTGVYKTKTM